MQLRFAAYTIYKEIRESEYIRGDVVKGGYIQEEEVVYASALQVNRQCVS